MKNKQIQKMINADDFFSSAPKYKTKKNLQKIIDKARQEGYEEAVEVSLDFFEKHSLNHNVGEMIVGVPRNLARQSILNTLTKKHTSTERNK